MVNLVRKFLPVFMGAVFISASVQVTACTISEDMLDSVPLNSTEIPNIDRLKIADMVYNAKQWPDVEIRGIISVGGYIKERDPIRLAEIRGAKLRDYLVQLGVRPEYIFIDRRTISVPYPVESSGVSGLLQIGVTLVPLCEGGCERLCNDSRVTPTSRAIK